MPDADPLPLLLEAASFAARAHAGQVRKDGRTPYAAHVSRVALIAAHVFAVADAKVLTAAFLHDTIEDTPTDFDDVAETFGVEVAGWVAMLTKEMRLPEAEREAAYREVLLHAPWPVVACKLADMLDNLLDSRNLPPAKRPKTLARLGGYLEVLAKNRHPETERAFERVAAEHAKALLP